MTTIRGVSHRGRVRLDGFRRLARRVGRRHTGRSWSGSDAGHHRAGRDQLRVELLDLAGLVRGRAAMAVAHGVEQVRGPREPVGVVREAWRERQAGFVGRAARGVVEQGAIAHVLGDGAETVEDCVVVAPVPDGLGGPVAVGAGRDRQVLQYCPARASGARLTAHLGQDPDKEGDHDQRHQHRDDRGEPAVPPSKSLPSWSRTHPITESSHESLVVGAVELLLQPVPRLAEVWDPGRVEVTSSPAS